jgi:hypothetical protein
LNPERAGESPVTPEVHEPRLPEAFWAFHALYYRVYKRYAELHLGDHRLAGEIVFCVPAAFAVVGCWVRDRSRERLHCSIVKALRNGGTVTEKHGGSNWQITIPSPPLPSPSRTPRRQRRAGPGRRPAGPAGTSPATPRQRSRPRRPVR